MDPLIITPNDRMLIIAPHPDDECIGPGGILCKYTSQCHVLVLSDGAIGQKDVEPSECMKIRKAEFDSEMDILGLNHFKMLNLPDGHLMEHTSCLLELDLQQYTKIFVTGYSDNHEDHTAAFLSLKNALIKSNNHISEVFVYGVHKTIQFPTHFFDITEIIDEKLNLIKCHKSQNTVLPYYKLAESAAEYYALQNRMNNAYIEIYEKVDVFNDTSINTQSERNLQKFKLFYSLLTKWMLDESEKNDPVKDFANRHQMRECVIYGYAELGRILEKFLKKNNVSIKYVIDGKIKGENIYTLGTEPFADVPVIVTAVSSFESIKMNLDSMGYHDIVSLLEIVNGEYGQ